MVANCRGCKLSRLQIVAVAKCRGCKMSGVAKCRGCKLSRLQFVFFLKGANCRGCKLSRLQIVAVANCRGCKMSRLQNVAVAGSLVANCRVAECLVAICRWIPYSWSHLSIYSKQHTCIHDGDQVIFALRRVSFHRLVTTLFANSFHVCSPLLSGCIPLA